MKDNNEISQPQGGALNKKEGHKIKVLTRLAHPKCYAKLIAEDGRTKLIKTKAELCRFVRHLGYQREEVVNPYAPRCIHRFARHGQTCPDCGLPAETMIQPALEWLEQLDGSTVDDPGYFQIRRDYNAIPGQEWRTKLTPLELQIAELFDSTCYIDEKQFANIRPLRNNAKNLAKQMARMVEFAARLLPGDCRLTTKQLLTLVIEALKTYVEP